ncbi:hypothetical protein C7S20_01255 [Christiangramia fulva]|uniref:Acyltransferase 3 domain-containing protein n=1 Tax=Christiangramia fulva TaxID=2126553 RepID=A0A2R3Z164_9FLAO|nr:hypothetical protein C7S20_01255 [Christiangramia fulva]
MEFKSSKNEINRISGLDSLRFLAFLFVFLFHTASYFSFGFLGVDFFFVLSSFLLTFLALKEIEKTGGFSQRNFFIRRALRIFPLYYLLISLSFLLLPVILGLFKMTVTLPEHPFLFWTFLGNYDRSDFFMPLKFFWSIAVEEQFYLLFLILSLFFRKYLLWIIGGLLTFYLAYIFLDQIFLTNDYKTVFYHFANFSCGMAGGYLFFKKRNSIKLWLPAFLILFPLVFISFQIPSLFNLALSCWFVSLIFVSWKLSFFIKKNWLFRCSEYLGKFTYGLYVYSGFVIIFYKKIEIFDSKALTVAAMLVTTFLISFFSYHFFEKHFLHLKKKFRSGKLSLHYRFSRK